MFPPLFFLPAIQKFRPIWACNKIALDFWSLLAINQKSCVDFKANFVFLLEFFFHYHEIEYWQPPPPPLFKVPGNESLFVLLFAVSFMDCWCWNLPKLAFSRACPDWEGVQRWIRLWNYWLQENIFVLHLHPHPNICRIKVRQQTRVCVKGCKIIRHPNLWAMLVVMISQQTIAAFQHWSCRNSLSFFSSDAGVGDLILSCLLIQELLGDYTLGLWYAYSYCCFAHICLWKYCLSHRIGTTAMLSTLQSIRWQLIQSSADICWDKGPWVQWGVI